MTYSAGPNYKTVQEPIYGENAYPGSIFTIENIIELSKNQYFIEMAEFVQNTSGIPHTNINSFSDMSRYCLSIYNMMQSSRNLPYGEVSYTAPTGMAVYDSGDPASLITGKITLSQGEVTSQDSLYAILSRDYSFYKIVLKNGALMRYLDNLMFMRCTRKSIAANGFKEPVYSTLDHGSGPERNMPGITL